MSSSYSKTCAPKKKVAAKEPAAAEKAQPACPFGSKPIAAPTRRSALAFPDLNDCQVVCAGDAVIKVERNLFARFSPQIKAMLFDSKLKEAQSGQILLKDLTSQAFSAVYQAGLGEFLRLPEVKRPFAELGHSDLLAAIRFTHAYEMEYVLALLLSEVTKRVPQQDFFDLDGELELDIQDLLLDCCLEHLRDDAPEKVTVFSDPEIYRTLWPVVFSSQAFGEANTSNLQGSFVRSLVQSKVLGQVLTTETLPLKNVPKPLLAKLAETMDGETAKTFLLRSLRD